MIMLVGKDKKSTNQEVKNKQANDNQTAVKQDNKVVLQNVLKPNFGKQTERCFIDTSFTSWVRSIAHCVAANICSMAFTIFCKRQERTVSAPFFRKNTTSFCGSH